MRITRFLRILLGMGLVVGLGVFFRGGLDRGPVPTQTSLAAAFSAQAQLTEEWLGRLGVMGTAVGLGPNGAPVVKVYATALGAAALPASVAGVPVSVEISGPFVAYGDPPSWARFFRFSWDASDLRDASDIDTKTHFPRPVPIGVSTGHPGVTAGTIGARVTDGTQTFALSNNHVFANNNGAEIGDGLLQPGVVDGGRAPDDVLATLHDFEPIRFCQGILCPQNQIDAAVALTSVDQVGYSTPENGYGTPRTETMAATIGMRVQKYGRTTGHTIGRVTGINATIDVNYRTGTARFEGQILVSDGSFSTGGDSGSLVVSKGLWAADRRPVGLLFAGSNTNTIVNPIDLVLDRFGVRVDAGG
jgi:hypothetical protein